MSSWIGWALLGLVIGVPFVALLVFGIRSDRRNRRRLRGGSWNPDSRGSAPMGSNRYDVDTGIVRDRAKQGGPWST